MKVNNKEIKGLMKSFIYAFRGLWFCIKNERNMRIHLVSSVLVLLFAFFYGLDATQYAILVLTMGLVVTSEAVNTAMEALVDLEADAYHNIARIVKDVAAGAVLISAVAAVGVGIALFFHLDRLTDTILTIISNPVYIVIFILIIVLGLVFIFRGIKPIERKENIKIYAPRPNITTFESKKIDYTAETKIYKGK